MPTSGWTPADRPLHFEHEAGAFLFWRPSSSCWVLVSWVPRPGPGRSAFVKTELEADDVEAPPLGVVFLAPPPGMPLPWVAG